MSEFRCPLVRIAGFGKHPDADTLSITQVNGENVIFKTGDFQKGDLAVYIPEGALVPAGVYGTEFLDRYKRRVRAVRLRGIYSEGVLLPASKVVDQDPESGNYPEVGTDLAAMLGITKYEEPIPPHLAGEAEKPPEGVPVYDIEPFKRYKHVFDDPSEEVVVTEKLHGTNARFVFDPERGLLVGSRQMFWKEDDRNLYWRMARQYKLAEVLSKFPGLVVYGEIYGAVQDLKYGSKGGECWFRVFDVYDLKERIWVGWPWVKEFCRSNGLETVPVLYEGPECQLFIAGLVEGNSTLADHIREGVVIKPVFTRYDPHLGRVILKWVSEGYKLRKGGTEMH